jgi:hypothetical protein
MPISICDCICHTEISGLSRFLALESGPCEPPRTSELESRVVATAKTCASRLTKELGLETASCQKYPPMSTRPFLGPRAAACAESGLAQNRGGFLYATQEGRDHRTSVRELPALSIGNDGRSPSPLLGEEGGHENGSAPGWRGAPPTPRGGGGGG